MKQKIVFWILVIIFFAIIFILPGCSGFKEGRFISTEQPIVILQKFELPYRGGSIKYFYLHLDELIRVTVSESMYNSKNVGDTLKNIALIVR